jgi:quercetin dioxygenase-like cupin family protein
MDTTPLASTARAQIESARAAAHGRSAHTVYRGDDRGLRQTIVALRAGTTLNEHHSSREATLQVLAGRVLLTADTYAREAIAGDLLPVPSAAHTLDAVEDSALLLTVGVVLDAPELITPAPGNRSAYSWQEDWE